MYRVRIKKKKTILDNTSIEIAQKKCKWYMNRKLDYLAKRKNYEQKWIRYQVVKIQELPRACIKDSNGQLLMILYSVYIANKTTKYGNISEYRGQIDSQTE